MRKISVLLLALVITGCGSGNTEQYQQEGQTLAQVGLVQRYLDTEQCVGFQAPEPIVLIKERRPTLYAMFFAPRLIEFYGMDNSDIPPHEFIHYLLYVKTGNSDSDHTSILFQLKKDGGCI